MWNTCCKTMKKESETAISSGSYPHNTDKAVKIVKPHVLCGKSTAKLFKISPVCLWLEVF